MKTPGLRFAVCNVYETWKVVPVDEVQARMLSERYGKWASIFPTSSQAHAVARNMNRKEAA